MDTEADILREFEHLERRLQAAYEQMINPGQVGMAGGPGGGGFEPADVARLNQAIRKAQGIDRMESRLEELRRQLAELRS